MLSKYDDSDSDEFLVEMMKAGDEQAFTTLVLRHQTSMRRLAYSILGCENTANDAVQESFLQFWRSIHQFEGRSAVRYWLSRIVWHRSLQTLRSNNHKPQTCVGDSSTLEWLSIESSDTPYVLIQQSGLPWTNQGNKTIEIKELRERLVDAVSELPSKYQVVFLMREFEGESMKSISRTLKIPIPTVKTRLHRARQELRQYLKEYKEFEEE